MADEYSVFLPEYAAGADGGLTSEQRRQLTLQNLAMSKAKKKKKKRQSSGRSGERKLTETERRAQEQARIREEREKRRALSEANRREAGIGVQAQAAAAAPEPEQTPPEPEQKKPAVENFPPDIKDINIDIPTETAAEQKQQKERAPAVKQKKKKTKKNSKTTVSRTARAGRYTKTAAPAAAYPNRITTGGAVTLGILTCVLIGTVIYGRVQTNEIYTEIAALQAEYDDLVARNVSMKSEMEGKMTVKNIEEYAENVLGLRPLNQSQIEYIQLQTEDEVIISEPESNFFVTINDYLVSFWEFLRGR